MVSMNPTTTCSCARHADGSVTTFLCSLHAEDDPCLTTARVTGSRRHGSVIRGTCTACGWSAEVAHHRRTVEAELEAEDWAAALPCA